MKLYTEDQVRYAIKKSYEPKNKHGNALEYWYSTDEVINFLTPIELPTDDEIDTYVESTGYYGHCTTEYREGIEEGAKWMRDKMKGGEQ